MSDHIISIRSEGGYTLSGSIDLYNFQAVVYDTPTADGIDGGRVVILTVERNYPSSPIADYRREWIVPPRGGRHRNIVKALLNCLAALPKQALWCRILKQYETYLANEGEAHPLREDEFCRLFLQDILQEIDD